MFMQSSFDSEIFGRPCYRLMSPVIEPDCYRLEKVLSEPSVFVDGKFGAEDVTTANWLLQHGFRKVCTQFELVCHLSDDLSVMGRGTLTPILALDADVIRRHAENFVVNRFRLDYRLECERCVQLYRRWIENSLSGRRQVIHIEENFITYSVVQAGVMQIDLVSILRRSQGIGSELLDGLKAYAVQEGIREICVTTECENRPAWRFYLRNGFVPRRFLNVFHFIQE
jgi:GNAT superfamily N-acetyltransferase